MSVCAELTKLRRKKILVQIWIQIHNGFGYVICVLMPNEAFAMLFVTRYHMFHSVNN